MGHQKPWLKPRSIKLASKQKTAGVLNEHSIFTDLREIKHHWWAYLLKPHGLYYSN